MVLTCPIAYASHPCQTPKTIMLKWKKRLSPWCLALRNFTSIYLYGRRFVLITDHKPLTAILGPKRGVPPLTAARMQRWALLLSAYDYDIVYRPTTAHGNADGLSRLPLPDSKPVVNEVDPSVFNIGQIEALPVQSSEIKRATRADKHLRTVLSYTLRAWPARVPRHLTPYHTRRLELSVEGECLLWGTRVISLRRTILGRSGEDEGPGSQSRVVALHGQRSRRTCQTVCRLPKRAAHACQGTSTPVDYACPMAVKMLLLVVDTHSKWPEVVPMPSSTTGMIQALRDMLARWGIPEQLVSDNGPQFTSDEFRVFMQSNGVKHIRTAPYHPATNGAAERLVQTVKRALHTGLQRGTVLEHCLSSFLLQYQNTWAVLFALV